MGVYFETYVILGWNIGTDKYKEFDPEPEDDEWENKLTQEFGSRDAEQGDIAVVYDGMGGRYCYFGEIVARTNSTRNGEQSFDRRVMIDGEPPAGKIGRLIDEAESVDLAPEGPPSYHVFTHAR